MLPAPSALVLFSKHIHKGVMISDPMHEGQSKLSLTSGYSLPLSWCSQGSSIPARVVWRGGGRALILARWCRCRGECSNTSWWQLFSQVLKHFRLPWNGLNHPV